MSTKIDNRKAYTTTRFLASAVLQVELARSMPQTGLSSNFFAWKVRAVLKQKSKSESDPDAWNGPGLYAIFYRGELIYIGKYLGRRDNPYSGNIVATRWWAHFATLTLLGHRVSIPSGVLDLLPQNNKGDLFRNLQQHAAITPRLTSHRGCVTSLNRLLFAGKYWSIFNTRDPKRLLNDFEFLYIRLRQSNVNVAYLRERISSAEDASIHKLMPKCNRGVPWIKKRKGSSLAHAVEELTASLTQALNII